jgi:transglutaminase-like putative cysteine protease
MLIARGLDEYLGSDDIVAAASPAVAELAARLRAEHRDPVEFARAAYAWVRDQVAHSVDAQDRRVTIGADDVLRERVGLCFAKSHLLVALVRNQGIPAGLCYQRLADGEGFALHGLVAVFLDHGWHRLDARGNKPGVDAQFSLGEERLAWQADASVGEVDYPHVYARPAEVVLDALAASEDALALCEAGLPSSL